MEICRRIRMALETRRDDARVADVRIGLCYTGIRLEDDRTGVAFTSFDIREEGGPRLDGLHPLAGRDATDLLRFLGASSSVERAVGLAAANALGNRPGVSSEEVDFLEALEVPSGASIGMVGFFGPVLPKLHKMGASVTVFEKNLSRYPLALPEKEAANRLPDCEIALITAASIVNGSVDRLLRAAESCREVVLLGVSTPLVAAAFSGTPVTRLSGVVVTEPQRILNIISEGGGRHLFKGGTRKVNISVRDGL